MPEKKEETMPEIEELIKKNAEGYTAKVTEVTKTTSEKYFGKTNYSDREGYEIVFQLDELPDVSWSEFFNIPKPRGLDESKIMDFVKAYGEKPKVGLSVKAVIVDGYFKVKL